MNNKPMLPPLRDLSDTAGSPINPTPLFWVLILGILAAYYLR